MSSALRCIDAIQNCFSVDKNINYVYNTKYINTSSNNSSKNIHKNLISIRNKILN